MQAFYRTCILFTVFAAFSVGSAPAQKNADRGRLQTAADSTAEGAKVVARETKEATLAGVDAAAYGVGTVTVATATGLQKTVNGTKTGVRVVGESMQSAWRGIGGLFGRKKKDQQRAAGPRPTFREP